MYLFLIFSAVLVVTVFLCCFHVRSRRRNGLNGAFYAAIFKAAADAILLMEGGRFIDVNAAAVSLFGMNRRQLLGLSPADVSPGSQPDGVSSVLASKRHMDLALRGHHQRFEWVHRRSDGTEFYSEVYLRRIFFEGRPHLLSFVRDVQARKELESDIIEKQQHFYGLFENSPISIWEEDYSAVKSYLESLIARDVTDLSAYFRENPLELRKAIGMIRILDVNSATVSLHHAKSKKELLSGLDSIFTDESERVFIEELKAIRDGRLSYEGESLHRTMDGGTIFVRVKWVAAPGHEADMRRVFVSVMDITEQKIAEMRLSASEEKYRFIAESSNDAILLLKNGKIFYANSRFAEMTGYGLDQIYAEEDYSRFFAEDRAWEGPRADGGPGDPQFIFEGHLATSTGVNIPVELSRAERYFEGENVQLMVIRDISERMAYEKAHRMEKALFEALFNGVPEGIILVDADSNIRRFNAAFERLFGWTEEEARGRNIDELLTDEKRRDEARKITSDLKNKKKSLDNEFETVRVKKDGTPVNVSILGVPVAVGDDDTVVFGVYRDITERKDFQDRLLKASKAMEELAKTDELTGLINRRGMMAMLDWEMRRFRRSGKRFSVAMADIDHFKAVNDSLGHEVGDKALKAVSDLMVSALRGQDLVSRWGGEEFLILFPETSAAGACKACEKIRERVKGLNGGSEFGDTPLTLTLGVAEFQKDIETTINRADSALYRGKEGGRDRVVSIDAADDENKS